MKKWIREELTAMSVRTSVPREALKSYYKRVLAHVATHEGLDGFSHARALQLVEHEVVPQHVAAVQEAREKTEPDARYMGVCWPDQVDALLAEAKGQNPGCEIEQVTVAQIDKGLDRGRVFVAIRMKERADVGACAPGSSLVN